MNKRQQRLVSIATLFVVGLLWGLATIRPLGALVYTSTPFVKVIYIEECSAQVIVAYMVSMGFLFASLKYTAFLVHGGMLGSEPSRSTQLNLIVIALCVFVLASIVLRPLIAAEHQRRLDVGADMLIIPPLFIVLASIVATLAAGSVLQRRQKGRRLEQMSGADSATRNSTD